MNILLVEDEKKIVDFVCAGFREQGFSVDHCADGNDGFAKANSRSYDVIVLDIIYRSHAPAWECRFRRSSVAFYQKSIYSLCVPTSPLRNS